MYLIISFDHWFVKYLDFLYKIWALCFSFLKATQNLFISVYILFIMKVEDIHPLDK